MSSPVNRRVLAVVLWATTFALTLVANQASANEGIDQPLTQSLPNAARGLAILVDRKRGHCLLCHTVSGLDESSQGNIGPTLDGIASRLSAPQLRLRLVDSTRLNPATAMPAYHRVDDLHQVDPQYADKPVLTASEIEDLIAYLQTLTASAGPDS